MPEYSTLVTLQDAADLLAYLLEQKAAVPAAAPGKEEKAKEEKAK